MVNTAARMASAAPGGDVWIGADTFAQIEDYIQAEPLELLVVKGKRQPVQVYEVVNVDSCRNKGQELLASKLVRVECNK